MTWAVLTTPQDLEQLVQQSMETPQVIFKHSTRCNISSIVKFRLEKTLEVPNVIFHMLDLIKYRSLSNHIAEIFNVQHESPQVLVIRNGKCTFDESHLSIQMEDIKDSCL